MKKRKKHKWKYQVNVKKKILVLAILGVSLFVGMGYALIQSEFTLGGTIEFKKLDDTLYDAIKKETATNYAVKYTGSHQDSMDSTKSTEDIYHYYASTAARGNDILDKNNVVFANTCWQMIRTTDTGGVRMIYNGEPEEIEVNGETRLNCGDTRNRYHMGTVLKTVGLSGTAIYAKNYTATTSGSTTTFTLVDDPDDPDDYKSITVNSSTATAQIADIVENYPYMCSTKTATCTNEQLYKVASQMSSTNAYAYQSTYRDVVGISAFNSSNTSPAYVGYMYGDVYTYTNNYKRAKNTTFTISSSTISSYSSGFNDTYLYSKTLNQTGTSSVYELDNPILGSEITDPDYSGYYTYKSSTTTSGAQPYYITGKYGSNVGNYYYIRLSSTKTLNDFYIKLGDNIVDNGDNTYTIKEGENPAIEVSPTDWYNNYTNYANKYTCGDTTDTCTTPKYIVRTDYYYYNNISADSITISTSLNGLQLSGDVKTIDKGEWYRNYNTTYTDHVYTCGNTNTLCTKENIKYITEKTATSYTYILNNYYGESVIYENNKYVLQNTVSLNTATDQSILTHRYTCLTIGETTCDNVAYIFHKYNYSNGDMRYITINTPNTASIEEALNAMFKKNTTNSIIKENVDSWYALKLLNTSFESKIDDTIYCNDRSSTTDSGYTLAESGWNDQSNNLQNPLYFKEGLSTSKDLSCTNITDRFSVSNNAAHLTYKIGLLTSPEIELLNQDNARKATVTYWLASPSRFSSDSNCAAYSRYVQNSGAQTASYDVTRNVYGVRPAISLVKGTKYSQGDGSMTNPYIVDMNN